MGGAIKSIAALVIMNLWITSEKLWIINLYWGEGNFSG